MENNFQKIEPHDPQIWFERTVHSIARDAFAIDEDDLIGVDIGMIELTELSIAAARINAFVLKHRRKVAA